MENFGIFADITSAGLFLATFTKFSVVLTPFDFPYLFIWVGKNVNGAGGKWKTRLAPK